MGKAAQKGLHYVIIGGVSSWKYWTCGLHTAGMFRSHCGWDVRRGSDSAHGLQVVCSYSLHLVQEHAPTLSSDLLVISTTTRETAVMKQKLYAQWLSFSRFVMVLCTFLWHLRGVWHCASDEVYVIRSLEEYTVLFLSRSKFTFLIHQNQIC